MQAAPNKPESKSSRQLYAEAAKAIASAEPRAAIEPLEQLIEDQPTSSLACIAAVHLAECYVATDREQDAVALLEKWTSRIAAESKKTKLDADLDAHHLRVWLQAAKRIEDEATALISLEKLTQMLDSRTSLDNKASEPNARSNDPETDIIKTIKDREMLVDCLVELAKRSTAAGKLDDAAEQLSRLTELASDASSETQLLVAMLHQQLGNHDQAKKLLQSLIKNDTNTPGQATSSHALARLELATYAMQEREPKSAEALLRPIIDSPESHHGLVSAVECRFRLLWSELELAKKNPAHALEVLPTAEELAKLDQSQQIAVRFGRAEAASQAGKNAAALEDLQWLTDYAKKSASEPSWAVSVALRYSELLLRTKDYPKLTATVEDAKKRFTNFERVHEFDYLLARAAMQQIDFDQARTHLKAITDSPSNNASATARAQWMIGETFFMEHNLSEAINAYKPVTLQAELQPWQSLALMQTAKCFELLKQPDNALEVYRRVSAITKDERIRQEATARIEVVERTASRTKPPSIR